MDVFDNGGEYNRSKLVKIIKKDFIKNIGTHTQTNGNIIPIQWLIFGDGSDVKILKNECDLDQFEEMSDYFRINQSIKLGWYIN